MFSPAARKRILNKIIEKIGDGPNHVTVDNPLSGRREVPLSTGALDNFAALLTDTVKMRQAGDITDAQLLGVVTDLATACGHAADLHYRMSPEQVEAARRKAIDELFPITDEDRAELAAIQPL